MKLTRSIINSLFKASPFIGLLPFIWLAFFAFPSMDDHYLNFSANKLGWLGSLKSFFLLQDSGRFGSFPFLLFFAKQDWVLNHYWFVALLFLALSFVSLRFLFSSVNNYLLADKFSAGQLTWIAAAVLFIYINIIPETASGLYWMTSLFQNQLALVYACLLIGLMIKNKHTPFNPWRKALAMLLLVMLCGSIEPAAIIVNLVFISYYAYCIGLKRKINKRVFLYHFFAIAATLTLFLMPGTRNRISYIDKDLPLAATTTLSFYELWRSFILLIGEPSFWLLIAGILSLKKNLKFQNLNYRFIVPCTLLLVYLLYFSLCYGINGMIALRTENILLFFLVMAIASIIIFCSNRNLAVNFRNSWIQLIVIIIFFSARSFTVAIFDIPSAYIYKKVMDKRIETIGQAKAENKKVVFLNTYFGDQVSITNDHGPFFTKFMSRMPMYPRTIFMHDDLTDYWAKSFAQFHKIDTIKTADSIYPRWGLDNDH